MKRKRCQDCERRRTVSCFYVNKKMKDGFYAVCKDCHSVRSAKWNNVNKISVAIRHKKAHKQLREQVLQAYGGKCTCCGEDTPEFLTIDHVNNDGNIHRKQIGTRSLYRWLRDHKFPKRGFQLLCYNCNMAKARYNKCPHKG